MKGPYVPYVFDVEIRVVSLANLRVLARAASSDDYEYLVAGTAHGDRTMEVHYKDRRGSSISVFYPTWVDAEGNRFVVLQAKEFRVAPHPAVPKWEAPWQAFAPLVESARYSFNKEKRQWEAQS